MSWLDVCAFDDIIPGTGVCALVGSEQIAIVRIDEEVFAVGNFDPFSRAFVMSHGIVGGKNGTPKIASPIDKQTFDLRTGRCLDDAAFSLPVYRVRVRRGRVEIAWP